MIEASKVMKSAAGFLANTGRVQNSIGPMLSGHVGPRNHGQGNASQTPLFCLREFDLRSLPRATQALP